VTPVGALPFAEAVRAGDLLFLSGQIGLDASGQLAGRDVAGRTAAGDAPAQTGAGFGQETRQVMENIGQVLQQYGLQHSDLVNVSVYLTDMADYTEMNKVYSGFFQGRFPSRVCIAVKELAMHARIEISAIAFFTSK